MLQSKNRYDSILIWYFAHGKDQLVPVHRKKQIPYSTISTWRATDYTVLIGHELRSLHEEAVEQYEVFRAHRNLKNTVWVVTKTLRIKQNRIANCSVCGEE